MISTYGSRSQVASAARAKPNALPSAKTPAGERPSPSALVGPFTGGAIPGSHASPLLPTTIGRPRGPAAGAPAEGNRAGTQVPSAPRSKAWSEPPTVFQSAVVTSNI